MRQGFLEHDLQNRHHQECAHTQADRIDQHGAVHNGADLIGQNLQVRLRNGDQHAQHKAHGQKQSQLPLLGKTGTHMGTHGGHGQVRAQTEQSDAQDQHHSTNGKGNQFRFRKIKQRGKRHQIHNGGDRQGGCQCLFDLFPQFLQHITFSFVNIWVL